MIWEKDKLRPTQPYFVIDTDFFTQKIYLKNGISHFYMFQTHETKDVRVVPDGCIDMFFEYTKEQMHGFVCGTPKQYCVETFPRFHDVFGVRFMPGIQPEFLNVTMKDLFGKTIPVDHVLKGSREWLKLLAGEKDFQKRIDIFIEAYISAEKQKVKPFGKKEMILSVKKMVYDSDGKIKIHELQEKTGYSERYINKVFIEEMGFSPKTFCKIIQFQRALEYLNYGAPGKMTNAAVLLGYYDQSQFIKDFTKYAGMTPKKYLQMVIQTDYKNKIIESSADFYNSL